MANDNSTCAGACPSGSVVCSQEADPHASKLLRPQPNLLLQLSQIQEEDESKASSRNSIDKVAVSSPGTSVRVVDNTASGAPSPAISARQVIMISKENIREEDEEAESDGE